jgi:regulator of RNase E activity RraA
LLYGTDFGLHTAIGDEKFHGGIVFNGCFRDIREIREAAVDVEATGTNPRIDFVFYIL